ncbi:MAG TPA: hypothetical protein EYH41_04775 [Novosphingobium capsulatum]|nr:hypothetical protein [Novosphingobium capsulatum]
MGGLNDTKVRGTKLTELMAADLFERGLPEDDVRPTFKDVGMEQASDAARADGACQSNMMVKRGMNSALPTSRHLFQRRPA